MIRARNVLRADAACHSGDVLTPVEQAVSSLPKLPSVPKGLVSPELLVYREGDCKWSDIPEIRELLLSLKENKNAAIR